MYPVPPAAETQAAPSNTSATSTIIGARSMEQLRSDIASAGIALSEEVRAGIEAIAARYPYPTP